MKKILSLLIVFALIISTVPVAFAAEVEEPVIYLKSGTEEAAMQKNAEIEIDVFSNARVTTSKWNGLFSYQIVLDFDVEMLEATDAVCALGDGGITNFVADNETGKATLWFSKAGDSDFSGSKLATFEFKVLDKGETDVSINETKTKFLKAGSVEAETADLVMDVDFGDTESEIYSELELELGALPKKPELLKKYQTNFTSKMTIKFAEREDGADIYYTTDGTTPKVEYIGTKAIMKKYDDDGILISKTCTIKAIAVIDDIASPIFSQKYVRGTGAAPGGGAGGGGGNNDTTTTPNTNIVKPVTPSNPTNQTTPAQKYADINSHWAKADIMKLINKGIISGYEDGSVKPDNGITRAEVATILVKALSKQPATAAKLNFSDAASIASWAVPYIKTAVDLGILKGYEDNSFRASQQVTRKEMVVMLARAFAITGGDAKNLTFTDKGSFQSWYEAELAAVVAKGVVNGYEDNSFRPDRGVTRAETCKMIASLVK